MRFISILGMLFIALGGYVLLRGGGNVKTEKEILKVGDVQVTTSEDHIIPPWAGAIVIVAGIAMVVSGTKKRW